MSTGKVRRYRVNTLPGRITRDCPEVVLATDYDQLAARLATVEGALQAEHDKRIEHDAMCGNLRTIEGVQAKLAEALAQLSTTQAALEAAQRDAGRYRYLCSLSNADWNRFGRVPDNEVDAAIDAAIAAGGEKGETT